jgi:hypothetical protein
MLSRRHSPIHVNVKLHLPIRGNVANIRPSTGRHKYTRFARFRVDFGKRQEPYLFVCLSRLVPGLGSNSSVRTNLPTTKILTSNSSHPGNRNECRGNAGLYIRRVRVPQRPSPSPLLTTTVEGRGFHLFHLIGTRSSAPTSILTLKRLI